jgi:hypothetical protein
MAPDKKGQKEREKCQNIWSMKRERSRGDFLCVPEKNQQIGDGISSAVRGGHMVCAICNIT